MWCLVLSCFCFRFRLTSSSLSFYSLRAFAPIKLTATLSDITLKSNQIKRPTAAEALDHPWILSGLSYSDEELWYPPDEGSAARQRQDGPDEAGDEECDGGGGGGVVIEEYVDVGGMAVVDGEIEGGGEVVSPRRRSF